MSVYGTSSGSKANIYGTSGSGLSLDVANALFIDTTEIQAYIAQTGLQSALAALSESQLPGDKLVNISQPQTITGQKTFNGGINSSNLTLTGGTTANDSALTLTPFGSTGQRQLRFQEIPANGTDYVAIRAPSLVPTTYTLTLPSLAPAVSSSLLTSNTSGTLTWSDASSFVSSTSPSFTAPVLFSGNTSSTLALSTGADKGIGFTDSTATYTTTLKSGAATQTYTLSLPTALPSGVQLLTCNTSGQLAYQGTSTYATTNTAQTISSTKTFTAGVISNQYISGATSSSYPFDIVQNVNSSNARIDIQNSNAGAAASAGLRMANDGLNAAELYLVSSASSEWPNALYLKNTAGDIKLSAAGTSNLVESTNSFAVTGTSSSLMVGISSSSYLGEFRRQQNSDVIVGITNTATGTAGRSILRVGNNANSGDFIYHSAAHSTQANNLIVKNNATAGNIRLQPGNTSTNFLTVLNGSANVGLNVDTPTYLLHLNTDSAAKPTSSTWTISSDERLKTDIQDADLDICYENIKKIPLRRYKWKPEVYNKEQINDDWRRVGFIAQEYAKIFPKDVTTGLFQKTHKEEIKVIDDETKEERTDYKTVVDFELKDCLSINTDQILTTLVGCVKKLIEIVDNQAESSDYTVSPMQMQISEGYGIVSNSIKHFNNKNVATLSFNFIVDDDVTANEWLELPLLHECKSVMLSNVVYIDEHGFDADRPFKIALSKTTEKLKVSFKNLNAVEKNIQKKLLINYIIS